VVVTRTASRSWGRLVAAATATRPIVTGESEIYRVRRRLGPLSATGSSVTAKAPSPAAGGGPLVRAAVHYDGRRGHVRVRLVTPQGGVVTATVSSTTGDAENPVAAVDSRGHAAVGFTELRRGKLLMRAATFSRGRWRVATLDSRREAIWSPKLAITPRGESVLAWSEDAKPKRIVKAAILTARGVWRRPVTLENGIGVKLDALSAGRASTAVCLWRDSSASEVRIRVSTYDGARWSPVQTVASTLDRLRSESLAGAHATAIRWQIWYPSKRLAFFKARRSGSAWIEPSGPTHVRRRFELPGQPSSPRPRPAVVTSN
jgi:hypothetical protein